MTKTDERKVLLAEFADDDCWRDYYQRFAESHGGEPLVIAGRQVFPDAWSFSSTSYAGPEYPPPGDPIELRRLLRLYWSRRLEVVSDESEALEKQIARAERRGIGNDKLEAMLGRAEWLADDIEQCERRLAELNGGPSDGEQDHDQAGTIVEAASREPVP